MKKCLIPIILMLLTIPVVLGLDICEDRLRPGKSCRMLTPTLECHGNYTIYNSTGLTIKTANTTLLNNSIYYFEFNLSKGDYIIKVCDNSTREIIVGEEDENMLQSTALFNGFSIIALIILTSLFFIMGMKKENKYFLVLGVPFLLLSIWMIGSNYYMASQAIIANDNTYTNLSNNNIRIYGIFLRIFEVSIVIVLGYVVLLIFNWFKKKKNKDREDRGF